MAVKLVRERIAELDTAVAEAKSAGADVAVAAAEKEIGGLEDSLDGVRCTKLRHLCAFDVDLLHIHIASNRGSNIDPVKCI